MKLTNQPNNNVPKIPPMHIIEPIHDNSSTESGPFASGEFSDDSSSKILDDNHPTDVPYDIVKKLTDYIE